MMKRAIPVLMLLAATAAAPRAQAPASDWCSGERWGSDRQGVCDVRQFTVPAGGVLTVNAEPNGGIDVRGESRGDVHILARVVAQAETAERARQIADAVKVDCRARPGHRRPARRPRPARELVGQLSTSRCRTSPRWRCKTTNGGISIRDVEGDIEFKTVNGGVKLANLSGDVKGSTSNGGVDVDLDGPSWKGCRARRPDQQRRRQPAHSRTVLGAARDRHGERRLQHRLPGDQCRDGSTTS